MCLSIELQLNFLTNFTIIPYCDLTRGSGINEYVVSQEILIVTGFVVQHSTVA